MPLVTPRKNEKRSSFISRCVSSLNDKSEFKTNEQRVAVCYSQWRKSHKKSKAALLVEEIADQLFISKNQNG